MLPTSRLSLVCISLPFGGNESLTLAFSHSRKVPSRIAYSPPPAAEIHWGNQIKANTKATVHACMKLRLDDKMKGSEQFRHLLAFLSSQMAHLDMDAADLVNNADRPPEYPGKDPVDMVADYLTKLREAAWVEIEKTYGKEMFASMRKELVVTVPAVWSERAKDLTLKAVQRAHFNAAKVSLVTEPEAAAIYTLKGMREGPNKNDVKVGRLRVNGHMEMLTSRDLSRSATSSFFATPVVALSI